MKALNPDPRAARRAPKLRSSLYLFASLLGDAKALQRGSAAKRLGRRLAGRASGKQLLRRLFK